MPGRASTRARCRKSGAHTTSTASQRRSPPRLEEQRHVEHDEAPARGARTRRGTAARPARTSGMEDRFEPRAARRDRRRRARPSAGGRCAPSLRDAGKGRRHRRHRRAARRQQRDGPRASASNTGTPMRRSIAAAVLLPMPTEPVRPSIFMRVGRGSRARRGAVPASPRASTPNQAAKPGRALVQQHAEPVDRGIAARAAPPRAAASRAAHRRCR